MDTQVIENKRERLMHQVSAACLRVNRSVEEVKLMVVTKTHHAEVVQAVVDLKLGLLGENRVQEAAEKRERVRGNAKWELIGHLQSNKSKQAVACFDRIQSVDREKLVGSLEKAVLAMGKKNYPVLMQVNAGRDPAKFGVEPEEAESLCARILQSEVLHLDGLMTIAPLSDDPEVARQCFANLRNIRDELQGRFSVALPELSMGMSGDFEIAIEEGSTLIRVGSALLGSR